MAANLLRWVWRRASSTFSNVVADWCIENVVVQSEIEASVATQSQITVDAAAQSLWSVPEVKVISCV